LDSFVLRAGLTQVRLTAARDRAEQRSKATAALCKGQFPDATPDGLAAVEGLRAERIEEGREAAERRVEKQREQRATEVQQERIAAAQRAKREQYRAAFLQLCEMKDAQQRGFQLERFLNGFLDFEGLNPRGSFKIIGEQIDGSFAWAASTYLVEAKWVKEPVAGAEFGAFIYKIAGKTLDTRGLYISINGYSPQAMARTSAKGRAAIRLHRRLASASIAVVREGFPETAGCCLASRERDRRSLFTGKFDAVHRA
jgi:hypothetical protein